MTSKIDIRDLKARALLWPDPVRSLILTESDFMPPEEFIAKIGMFERLLKIQTEMNQK